MVNLINLLLVWENNRAEFISFFEQNVVSRRLYEEYGEVLSSRIRLLREAVGTTLLPKYRPIFPPLRDLVSFPEVQAMIDPHRSHKFGRREIKYLVSIIDDIITSWKADCTKQLEEAFRSEAPYIPEATAILDLAITNITRCRAGPKPCRVLVAPWPNAVIHPCKWNSYWRNAAHVLDPEHDPGRWCSLTIRRELNRRWSKHDIETLIRGVAKIVQACGKDPLRTTAEDMDGLDLRFYCAREEHESGIREIMEWRQAVGLHRKSTISNISFESFHRRSRNQRHASKMNLNVKRSLSLDNLKQLIMTRTTRIGEYFLVKIGRRSPISNRLLWNVLNLYNIQVCGIVCGVKTRSGRKNQWLCTSNRRMFAHILSLHHLIIHFCLVLRHSIETPGEDDLFLSHEEALPMECSVYIVRNAKKKSRRLPFEVKEAFDQGRAALWSEIFG